VKQVARFDGAARAYLVQDPRAPLKDRSSSGGGCMPYPPWGHCKHRTSEPHVTELYRKPNVINLYEDRGSIDGHGVISGGSGFGAKDISCRTRVFRAGRGGTAEFIMVATQTGPNHYRCLRKIAVTQPTKFSRVPPGTY
jgi:hypothetical protein